MALLWSRLMAMRDHFLGKCRHRLSDHGMIHDPALVKVTDELVHPVFAAQCSYPLDAIIRVAEYADLTIKVFVFHLFQPGLDRTKSLKASDVVLAERTVQRRPLTQKSHQARLAILPRLRPAGSNMDREGKGDVAGGVWWQHPAINRQSRLELVRWIDQR